MLEFGMMIITTLFAEQVLSMAGFLEIQRCGKSN
nr:MAG TPA: hypothetical protein [Caudoviricetes sp.]